MNREEIMTLLPHRTPMLLLDDAEAQEGIAVGHYTVRGDEYFLQGHFPGKPIVPGVILCEILAQSACVLLQDALKEEKQENGKPQRKEPEQSVKLPVFAGIRNAKFRAPVRPGDRIETRCCITRAKYPFYFAEGNVSVDGQICASAEFSFAITEM